MKKYITILFLFATLQSIGQTFPSIEYSGKKLILPSGTNKDTLSTIKILRDSLTGLRTFLNTTNLDYPNDSVAIASGGLLQWQYYRTGNVIKSVISDLWVSYYTGMFYAISNRRNIKVTVLNYGGQGNFGWTAYWSNLNKASTQKFSGTNSYTITNTFGDTIQRYSAFAFQNYSQVQELHLDSIYSYSNLADFTNLYAFQVQNSFLPSSYLSGLPTTLKNFNVFTSSPVWVDFGLLPAGLLQVNISSNSGVNYARVGNTPVSVTTFTMTYDGLTTTDINTILTALDGIAFTGHVTIDLRQGGAAPPSGAGSTAKTDLINKGNTVTTD